MKVAQLKEQLKDVPDDIEVFIRCCVNPCGNIVEASEAKKDTYGFFGKSIDCIIIEPERWMSRPYVRTWLPGKLRFHRSQGFIGKPITPGGEMG